MKQIIAIIMIAAVAACGGKQEKSDIEQQIRDYKTQVRDLNKKISTLQEQLANMESSSTEFRLPVEVKTLAPELFSHYFDVNGYVEAENSAFVSPETNGRIETIHVREGQRVSKGQRLVTLNTDVTEKTIQEVKTNLELAQKVYQKQKDLWDKEIGSEIEYLRAKNNKESLESRLETLKSQLEMAILKAPFAGVVDEISLKEGEMASPGMQLLNLVNLRIMKIEGNVAERYLPFISKGDTVVVDFPVYENYKRKTPIRRVGNVINQDSRTFTIEMQLANPGKKIKPNLMAVITVNDFTRDSAMVVPSIIVKEDRQGEYLYTVEEKDGGKIAAKTYVKAARSYNDKTMIAEGLEFGDKVITSGYEQVSDGSNVKISKD